MTYHDELLLHAMEIVADESGQTQAKLRRAVSSAYYGLFHLLIHETVANWSQEESRGTLARMFEHGVMRKVSSHVSDAKKTPYKGEDPARVIELRTVANAFVQLQDRRTAADYDNTKTWTRAEAEEEVAVAIDARARWQAIREEKSAQDYLVSLLIRPRA